jgi:uncharacterized protein
VELFEVREHNGEHAVFATQAIEAGTEICRFTGKPIYFEETLELGSKESFAFQVGKDLYIYLDKPFRYFNHSCDPNCGITIDQVMITLKAVAKNEELRWDYSTSMLEHHWTMKNCNCKNENCRHVIGDFNTLPKIQQRYYIDNGVVQGFILETITK